LQMPHCTTSGHVTASDAIVGEILQKNWGNFITIFWHLLNKGVFTFLTFG
jgi:hypothetical protein